MLTYANKIKLGNAEYNLYIMLELINGDNWEVSKVCSYLMFRSNLFALNLLILAQTLSICKKKKAIRRKDDGVSMEFSCAKFCSSSQS